MNTTIAHSLTQAHGGEALRPIVALVAHDGRKQEMIEWATFNRGTLERCTLYATRTTGKGLGAYLDARINLLLSGPLGGDAQLGSLIAESRIDVDVKALLRLAVLHDVPIACNRSSADYLISSPLFVVPQQYREDRGIGRRLAGAS